ncbi:MAG: hypothetical protein JWM93_2267 [Frankiales bacterium]|nr:hypothetical protein [Frankiales bacterium]
MQFALQKTKTLVAIAVVTLTASITAFGAASAQAKEPGDDTVEHGTSAYEIGLFGDMPYGDIGRAQFPAVLADMNSAKLAFSLFDGDIKNGSEPCYADVDGSAAAAGKPDIYTTERDLLNTLKAPVAFVPGDNEWTDCDRPATKGPTFNASQRLAYERTIFAATDRSLGARTMRLTRQSPSYPENWRFASGPVTYVGLNVPGSDNNYIADGDTKNGPQAEANAEYAARNAANLLWLKEAFTTAESNGSKAVMVVLQADMFSTADPTTHFADMKAELARQSIAFNGRVVLINGDSHYFVEDKPLTDAAGNVIENFTRVMTFGSGQNHWVSATVDAKDPNIFEFHQHIVAANVPVYVAP